MIVKKKLFLFLFPLFLFTACPDPEPSKPAPDTVTTKTDEENSKSDENNTTEQKTLVTLQNNSQFKVNVYSDSSRLSLLCTLDRNETENFEDSESIAGSVYYITYLVDVGVEISWFNNDSYIIVKPEKGKTKEAPILDPQTMKVSDCFVIIENLSSVPIEFKQGNGSLSPENDKANTIVDVGEKGVYKIPSVFFGNFSDFAIVTLQNTEIVFPVSFTSFESGKIFTISVGADNLNNLSTSLKSISPFDIDTQKQIWTASVSSQYSVDCVRSAYDVVDGSFYTGSVVSKKNTIFIESFDVYGNVKLHKEYLIAYSDYENVFGCSVIDAFQNANKEYVLLLQLKLGNMDSAFNSLYYLGIFDESGTEKSIINLTTSVQELGLENLWFYGNLCKGAVCELSQEIYGIFCAAWNSDAEMFYFASLVDFTTTSPSVTASWKSENSTNIGNGIYRAFTSAYFDGTDFYVTGYDNFDGKYGKNSDVAHKGVIYKISSGLSSVEEIYSAEKTLFFGIIGKENSYYACGEAMGSVGDGNLYGAFLSSDMVNSNTGLIKYHSTKENAIFYQIAFTNNGIALCGQNSSAMDFSSTDTTGVLTCFSSEGTKLWENIYSDYLVVVSMCENNIGTPVLHLKEDVNSNKIVSTNLLGGEQK